jgi:hypothetical protein
LALRFSSTSGTDLAANKFAAAKTAVDRSHSPVTDADEDRRRLVARRFAGGRNGVRIRRENRPTVEVELDELILLLKHTFHMTVIVVTHELPSAFLIADRIAMLYQGSFSSVGTKEQLKASQNPRVRQFLDRVPEDIVRTPVTEHFAKYLNASEGYQ